MHCARIDLPKPSVPEIRPTLVKPRALMSAKIFSHAMRSVCGVLKTYSRTGSMISTAPASEMNGTAASSNTGIIAIVVPVVVPPTMATTSSSSIRRVAKVRALLASPPSSIEHELERPAEHAAGSVDALDIHLERPLLGIAEEGGRAGGRQHRADLDGVGGDGGGGQTGCGQRRDA